MYNTNIKFKRSVKVLLDTCCEFDNGDQYAMFSASTEVWKLANRDGQSCLFKLLLGNEYYFRAARAGLLRGGIKNTNFLTEQFQTCQDQAVGLRLIRPAIGEPRNKLVKTKLGKYWNEKVFIHRNKNYSRMALIKTIRNTAGSHADNAGAPALRSYAFKNPITESQFQMSIDLKKISFQDAENDAVLSIVRFISHEIISTILFNFSNFLSPELITRINRYEKETSEISYFLKFTTGTGGFSY